ncbi:uncharacterized protein B0I36DRAFT_365546 [Microdochium trichocladiopsis]|uniref:Uncharacterized protein n=1 Tax=Microdochium trichocladiopsis TaxID=1682393 RepID=A0A9P9BJS9_9PEZI|nr:uncharacterized protein B0I36DRAFT_365546 [Microdochium trichocladiopsis]KAH7025899.1 hypothetical protein B0I36DRAFT_365546 [Microdochium trichocladiopsis]
MEASSRHRYGLRRQASNDDDGLLNPNISLGKCYFGPNQPAADNFIPCGNYAFDTYSCCQAGDNCLASNACYNYRGDITYIAGCTDSTYNSSKCPNKGSFGSQQWSGLVQCDAKAGTWTNCQEADGATAVQDANKQCSCGNRQPLFTASAILENLAALPLAVSGSISWVSGNTPTATSPTITPSASTAPTSSSASSATTTSGSSSAVSSGTPSTSNMAQASPTGSGVDTGGGSGSTGLSQGAAIGIGVGCGVGALLIIAVGVLLCMLRRRRRTEDQHSVKSSPHAGGDRGSGEMSSVHDRPVSTWQGSNAGAMDSPVMSGFKSELPANDVPRPPPAELDSTATPNPTVSPSLRGAGTATPSTPMTVSSMAHDDDDRGAIGDARNKMQPPIAELE